MRAMLLAATLLAALNAGCATSVDVSFDPADDFSRYSTWEWLPGARTVDAIPQEERALAALASRVIAAELERRGLLRVDGGADLLVGYALRVERHLVALNETGAPDLLASHHSSPSYLVQSSKARIEIYDYGHLQVVMTDGVRERRVWWGELWARRRGEFGRHLPGVVSRLFEELPEPAKAPPAELSSARP